MFGNGSAQFFRSLSPCVCGFPSVEGGFSSLDNRRRGVKIRLPNGEPNHFWAWWGEEGCEPNADIRECTVDLWHDDSSRTKRTCSVAERTRHQISRLRVNSTLRALFFRKSTGWDLNPGERICNPRRSRSDTRAVCHRLRGSISTRPILTECVQRST